MGASITLAGEDLIAQKQGAQQALNITRFIFANVPGLDPSAPLDRAAPKPPAAQIVHEYTIPAEHRGYVNPSQVVYSAQIGSDVGDWDFNWIGLESAEGVLFAVSTVALQQKRRNIPPIQVGNNLTRNFLVVFDGAQALTGITIDASTWQHDFTVRLAGIDERERQSNRDIYGRACFFGSSLQLEKVGAVYRLKPGSAYIEGVRLHLPAAQAVTPSAFPTTAWLDVALQRELSDVIATWSMAWGSGKADYVDSAGVQHYLVPIAELPNSTAINDLRPVEAIDSTLLAFINTKEPGITAGTTAQYWSGNKTWRNFATDVRGAILDGLSVATATAATAADTVLLAIGKLQAQVTALNSNKLNATANAVSATKLQTARTIGGVAFDGTANINLPGVNAAGNQNTSGNAGSATKLATARTIGGVAFDGTGNINLPGVNAAGNQNTSGNAGSATKLATARTIGGVAFDGTANISLPGVNVAGSQNTTGNAATATKLAAARTINGVPFDGTANITVADATKLPLGGGSITGQIVAATRQAGIYGTYDSTKIDHIWSMGATYRVAADGSDFGGLYGIAYKHTNNASGGTMAAGHQIVFCSNGEPRAAIGLAGNFWTTGTYTGSGVGLTNIPQAGVTGLVAALGTKAPLASPAFTGTPTVPTAAAATNNTQAASTAFVKTAIAAIPANTASLGGPSGWHRCADTGLITQWTTITMGDHPGTHLRTSFTFPLAFPNECLHLIPSITEIAAANTPASTVTAAEVAKSRTGCTLVLTEYSGAVQNYAIKLYAVGR